MELCELDRSMMVSIDILPVPTDEAVRELQNKLLGVETNVAGWQRRQNNANNYTANVPYDMQLQRKETTEFLNDLTERDQRMMYGLVTVVHLAESKEQLDADTESLLAVGRKHLCQLSTLRWQQRDGLDTVLPVPFPVSWTVKMKKKQKETQDILSYHTQAAGCSDKARAKASGGRQPIEECGRTGL